MRITFGLVQPGMIERQDADGRSAQDVSVVRMEENEKVTWRVEETISFDHVPILME